MSEDSKMTDLHAIALRAGVFQVVEREAKAAKDQARAELIDALPFGDSVAGRYGDEIVCKASWSKGSRKVTVTDERAFLRWVKQNHPTEIVESVNPAYLASLKQVGDVLVDKDGQVVDGVEVVQSRPSLTVRSEKDALELVTRMVSDGLVSLDGLKEIVGTSPVVDERVSE